MKTALLVITIIISFLPGLCVAAQDHAADADAIAVVLGKTLTVADGKNLRGVIFGALLEQYAKNHGIEPTDAELDAFVARTEEMQRQQEIQLANDRERLAAELKSPGLTDRERKEKTTHLQNLDNILKSQRELRETMKGKEELMKASRRNVAQHFVRAWKLNKSLHETYGGRIIFQQAGPEPLDAYRMFLEEQQRKGAFKILRKEYEEPFWRYFVNDAMHTFYSKTDGDKLMKTPWWLLDKPL